MEKGIRGDAMNLEKAIEIQKDILVRGSMIDDPDDRDAIKLGIEAGKRTIQRRENLSWKFEPLLPGETPSGDLP